MRRIHGLDALRGIAALLVACGHAELLLGLGAPFSHNWLAVDFFFALSGFVMARTYEGRFPTTAQFVLKRWLRFAPVMAAGALLGFFALLPETGASYALLATMAAMLFLPIPDKSGLLFPANPPAWTIQLELLVNLAHAALLRRLSTRWLLALVIFCAAVMIAAGVGPNSGEGPGALRFAPLRVLLSYCVGIVLFRCEAVLPRLPFWIAPLLLVAGPVAAAYWPWLDWPFVLAGVPLVMIAGLAAEREVPLLGPLSFPLYGVHYPVIELAFRAGLSAPAALAAAVLVALVVMHWVDGRRIRLPAG